MKCIDRLAGTLLTGLLPAPAAAPVPDAPASLLLVRPGGIGDAVHLIAAVRAIRNKLPNAAIDILAEKRNASIFALSGDVRRVRRYDIPSEFLSLFRESYDIVIDSEQWHRLSAVVSRLTRGRFLIGFDTNERRRLFNFTVPYSHEDYEADSFLRLLEPLGVTAEKRAALPWLTVPSGAAARGAQLLEPFHGRRFVAMFPGASIPERRWGADRFRGVAEMLAEAGIPTVVVGGAEDADDGEEIVGGLGGINLAGKTSMPETAAVIDRCAVLVSGDSGILHVGVGLGRPTVSLFGPGIAAKWAPTGEKHVVIDRRLSCSPCTRFGYTPRCAIGARCMTEISAEEVFSAAVLLINRKTP